MNDNNFIEHDYFTNSEWFTEGSTKTKPKNKKIKVKKIIIVSTIKVNGGFVPKVHILLRLHT